MDVVGISAVAAGVVTVAVAVGSILLKAFVYPIKQKTELNATFMKDHEERIRHLEGQASAHSIHLENLMKAVDRLVTKIDELVSYERAERMRQRATDKE